MFLRLLKRLQTAGIPVVSIFLSGRPLWVNPELNASDAFVAAWLPGSEGNGVADVIFRAADGAIAHDFTGRLAHSWPRTPVQTPLNRGDQGYDPLFAFGFGLTYEHRVELGLLSEDRGAEVWDAGRTVFFSGAPVPPWQLFVGDSHNRAVKTVGGAAATWDRDNLVVTAVDRERQDDARAARWAGDELASVYLAASVAIDLRAEAEGCMALAVDVLVEESPSELVFLAVRCGEECEGRVDITEALSGGRIGGWRTLTILLSRLRDAGAELSHVTAPFVLETEGTLALRFANVRLEKVSCD